MSRKLVLCGCAALLALIGGQAIAEPDNQAVEPPGAQQSGHRQQREQGVRPEGVRERRRVGGRTERRQVGRRHGGGTGGVEMPG